MSQNDLGGRCLQSHGFEGGLGAYIGDSPSLERSAIFSDSQHSQTNGIYTK
jgi:hypothetical protein